MVVIDLPYGVFLVIGNTDTFQSFVSHLQLFPS